ncbi:MAG: permease-like cell division protein FtsX [Marinifilaceae bacterium]|nr:permease-like cell division protein FtsX [Marinifilaceae bacterium]
MAKKGRSWGSYVAALLSITLVLTMSGALVFVLLNAKSVADRVRENLGCSIILKDKSSSADVSRLKKVLDARPYVYSTEYISKERAAEEFKKDLGEDFELILGYNPLRPSIELKLQPEYANVDSIEMLIPVLLREEIIQEVSYQKTLVQLVSENVRRISLFMLTAIAIFLLISFVLIRNTIHQYVHAKRFLIKTMQLVGAKASFIARPFVGDGLLLGLFSSLLAILLLYVGVYLLQEQVADVLMIMEVGTLVAVAAVVVTIGLLVSWISSWISVIVYLRRGEDELY